MTVRLRAHHLLCMLTFAGEGYTPDFVSTFGAVIARIRSGERIELVDGSDDVCAPLAHTDDRHCDGPSARRRDREALRAVAGHDERPLRGGFSLDAAAVAALRVRFAAGTIRRACAGCEWSDLCTRIAADGFAAAAL